MVEFYDNRGCATPIWVVNAVLAKDAIMSRSRLVVIIVK